MRPLIALVGRPNVGKSTLFNRIVGRRVAIVDDLPGVTRDRNYADAEWDYRRFTLIDTGGFDPLASQVGGERNRGAKASGDGHGGEARDVADRLLASAVQKQAQLAADEAALIVLLCDGVAGITSVDQALFELMRGSGRPIFIAVNKIDSTKAEDAAPMADFYQLGAAGTFSISAEHGRGIGDLLDAAVLKLGIPREPDEAGERTEDGEILRAAPPIDNTIRLAIIGRPNVGKSSLVNALTGGDRFVVSAVPGTTRDSLDAELNLEGQRFVLTDTAGIRRKRSIAQRIEQFSVVRALRAVENASVVVCVLDATEAGAEQDAKLLAIAHEKGKALLIAVNKWDLAEAEGATAEWYRSELYRRLPFVSYAPIVFVSAKTGNHVDRILRTAARLWRQSATEFGTPVLNRLLGKIQDAHPAPLDRGQPVKLFYMTQVGRSPLTLMIQCSRPTAIRDPYRRFVENRFRETFKLEVPLRLVFKERPRRKRPGSRSET